jgi:hypothetical protein
MTCKDCKFFVQVEKHRGTCMKKQFKTHRSGQIQRKPDGTPYPFIVFWGTNACKRWFERKDTE